jgi:hypothetical protein
MATGFWPDTALQKGEGTKERLKERTNKRRKEGMNIWGKRRRRRRRKEGGRKEEGRNIQRRGEIRKGYISQRMYDGINKGHRDV